jgi:hypothetical protein
LALCRRGLVIVVYFCLLAIALLTLPSTNCHSRLRGNDTKSDRGDTHVLISFIKFFHILCILGLLGSVIYCLALVGSRKFPLSQPDTINRLHQVILLLALLALFTGTLLVLPKHFSFHTPWIKAAYVFTVIISLIVTCFMLFSKKWRVANIGEKISRRQQWLWRLAYFLLLIILLGVVRDAVMKSTFLF